MLAQKLAEEKGADIIVGTDPDCDRVGAMVRNDKGEYVVLTGNMTGALLTEYKYLAWVSILPGEFCGHKKNGSPFSKTVCSYRTFNLSAMLSVQLD